MKRSHGACIVALALGVAATSHAAMPITDCSASVPAHEKGVLQNDVVCDYRCNSDRSIVCGFEGDELCPDERGCDPEQVRIDDGAVLDLNGHDLVAAFHTNPVYCVSDEGGGRCVVKGPGHIWGGTRGILSSGMDVVVKNVTISADYDAVSTQGRVTMVNADLVSGFLYGIYGARGVKLKHVHALGAEQISSDGDIELTDVEIGPSSGPSSGTVVSAGTIRGRDVVLKGSASLDGHDVVVRRASSVANANGETGTSIVGRRRLSLVDSNVVQIASGRSPRLVRSTCQQSFVVGTDTETWGVCSGD